MSTHNICFTEALVSSTHNICYLPEIRKMSIFRQVSLGWANGIGHLLVCGQVIKFYNSTTLLQQNQGQYKSGILAHFQSIIARTLSGHRLS